MHTMNLSQAGILAPLPSSGRYIFFSIAGDTQALRSALARLQTMVDGRSAVVGMGPQLMAALGCEISCLREFPALQGTEFSTPSTPEALCIWLRGPGRGEVLTQTRELLKALRPAFAVRHIVDSFLHQLGESGHGRDLTGYEDGTENPQDEDASAAALCADLSDGLNGGSCWVLQKWEHDFSTFERMATHEQDNAMGRRRSDNEELEDAPESAHVKRTAQEDFEPEAFLVRRSMPWWSVSPQAEDHCGLMFSAFGHRFDAFEAQMHRMLGLDDGISDALFKFSKPLTGCYLWCPPMRDGKLDLRQLGELTVPKSAG